MPFRKYRITPVWQHQADATLDQASPVSGTKYEVLNASNVRILSISLKVTWSVQPTPLECHITIDGVTIVHSKTDPVSATDYIAIKTATSVAQYFETTDNVKNYPYMYEGRSVKIEAEITGGTVSRLEARVKYQRMI